MDEPLQAANQQSKNQSNTSQANTKSKLLVIGSTPTRDALQERLRSLLACLPIPKDEKDSILQFCVDIQASQAAADLDKLEASSMGPSIPWLLPRQLELRLGGLENRMWMHPNINHLAPISLEMWKFWASLSEKEIAKAILYASSNE